MTKCGEIPHVAFRSDDDMFCLRCPLVLYREVNFPFLLAAAMLPRPIPAGRTPETDSLRFRKTCVPQADTPRLSGTDLHNLNALKQSDLRQPPRLVWISL